MSGTAIKEILMTGTSMTSTGTITVTALIAITLQATTGGEKINAWTMKTGTGRVTRTTDVLIKNKTLERRSGENRQRNTHERCKYRSTGTKTNRRT